MSLNTHFLITHMHSYYCSDNVYIDKSTDACLRSLPSNKIHIVGYLACVQSRTNSMHGTMMIPTNYSLRCRFANGSFTLHTLSLPPPLNVVYCGTMLGFAQLSFLVNIDRWGKGRAETEAMYRVGVFLYERELCPNEIIRQL
jgi:hypothetical protein